MSAMTPQTCAVRVTATGLRHVTDQIYQLEARLGELRAAMEDEERSDDIVEAYQRADRELAELRAFVVRAVLIDEGAGDRHIVEVGDTVVIGLEDGSEEAYVIVHAVEAAYDERRISLEAPLARAVLHMRVGDHVTVAAPAGAYRCTILGTVREPDVASTING